MKKLLTILTSFIVLLSFSFPVFGASQILEIVSVSSSGGYHLNTSHLEADDGYHGHFDPSGFVNLNFDESSMPSSGLLSCLSIVVNGKDSFNPSDSIYVEFFDGTTTYTSNTVNFSDPSDQTATFSFGYCDSNSVVDFSSSSSWTYKIVGDGSAELDYVYLIYDDQPIVPTSTPSPTPTIKPVYLIGNTITEDTSGGLIDALVTILPLILGFVTGVMAMFFIIKFAKWFIQTPTGGGYGSSGGNFSNIRSDNRSVIRNSQKARSNINNTFRSHDIVEGFVRKYRDGGGYKIPERKH